MLMQELLRRFRVWRHRAEYERDLEDEMAHHLAMLAEDKGLGAAANNRFITHSMPISGPQSLNTTA